MTRNLDGIPYNIYNLWLSLENPSNQNLKITFKEQDIVATLLNSNIKLSSKFVAENGPYTLPGDISATYSVSSIEFELWFEEVIPEIAKIPNLKLNVARVKDISLIEADISRNFLPSRVENFIMNELNSTLI